MPLSDSIVCVPRRALLLQDRVEPRRESRQRNRDRDGLRVGPCLVSDDEAVAFLQGAQKIILQCERGLASALRAGLQVESELRAFVHLPADTGAEEYAERGGDDHGETAVVADRAYRDAEDLPLRAAVGDVLDQPADGIRCRQRLTLEDPVPDALADLGRGVLCLRTDDSEAGDDGQGGCYAQRFHVSFSRHSTILRRNLSKFRPRGNRPWDIAGR
jgi:hypothetical protein